MFIPSFMTRKPVCDLEAPTPPAELEPVPSPAKTEGLDEVVEEEDEDEEEENEADPVSGVQHVEEEGPDVRESPARQASGEDAKEAEAQGDCSSGR